MPDITQSAKVTAASGIAQLDFVHGKSGVQWIVSQISNSTSPFRVGSTVTVKRNGRYLTSTPLASGDSASGPPAYLLNASDVLSLIFTGMTVGDQVEGTLFYDEKAWSPNPTGGGIV